MKKFYKLISLVIFMALVVILGYILLNNQADKTFFYKVVGVVDGDTIDVNIDGTITRVRLIGIDTPELVDPRQPVECFAQEASDKAKKVLTGKQVKLEPDPTQDDQDKYGRLLRYVFLEDDTNFNKLMIAEGYAHEYTYEVPYTQQAEFKQAQDSARINQLGLWKQGVCQ